MSYLKEFEDVYAIAREKGLGHVLHAAIEFLKAEQFMHTVPNEEARGRALLRLQQSYGAYVARVGEPLICAAREGGGVRCCLPEGHDGGHQVHPKYGISYTEEDNA